MIDIKVTKRGPDDEEQPDEPTGETSGDANAEETSADAEPGSEAEGEASHAHEEHHGHTHNIPEGEEPRWLDDDANVAWLSKFIYVLAALVFLPELFALADALYHKHGHFGFDDWLGFYPVYGFVAYSLVVVVGLGLQKLVSKEEGYYDD